MENYDVRRDERFDEWCDLRYIQLIKKLRTAVEVEGVPLPRAILMLYAEPDAPHQILRRIENEAKEHYGP